jgi:putative nucleotidyltransferase with HDIG domain
VSRRQLIDLSDLDQPLLRKMSNEAPGSWQHARAMANLAEDAAAAIGADAMLTRTGAYYHDLGKTIQPKYFVENLEGGERSPHEDLEPDVSADAIMAHVVGGTKILRDAGIPEPIVEFAYTHHGTSVIEFFWHKCQQQGNPKGLGADAFRYPGMKPHTRETAILMLIDSIEAASRTIDPPEREKFEEMIQRVIFTKMKQGQLDESGLTVEDLRVLTTSIADTLVKVYHHRIKYPWQKPAAAATSSSERVEPAAVPVPQQAESAGEAGAVEEEPIEGPRASEPPPPPRAGARGAKVRPTSRRVGG